MFVSIAEPNVLENDSPATWIYGYAWIGRVFFPENQRATLVVIDPIRRIVRINDLHFRSEALSKLFA
jgi:hypothetical protein